MSLNFGGSSSEAASGSEAEKKDSEKPKENQFSGSELQEFKELFDLIDTDGSGEISSDELDHLVRILGINISQAELQLMLSEIDEDGSGTIDFEEFMLVMTRREGGDQYEPKDVMDAFKLFRRDTSEKLPSGQMSVADLHYGLTHYGSKKLSDQEAKDLIQRVNAGESDFDFERYVTMMMKK